MALEINRAPIILVGQAAKDFQKKVENFTIKETAAEVKEEMRQFREFMAKQKHMKRYA
jgi:hypothetical protein